MEFPVVAFSPSGWMKVAASEDELTEASPKDDLLDWQGLEIYDSAGRCFIAARAFRASPRSWLGLQICRLFTQAVQVGFELAPPQPASLEDLKARIAKELGADAEIIKARSHREIIRVCV